MFGSLRDEGRVPPRDEHELSPTGARDPKNHRPTRGNYVKRLVDASPAQGAQLAHEGERVERGKPVLHGRRREHRGPRAGRIGRLGATP